MVLDFAENAFKAMFVCPFTEKKEAKMLRKHIQGWQLRNLDKTQVIGTVLRWIKNSLNNENYNILYIIFFYLTGDQQIKQH